ncbi:MAG: cation:proton antiporter [Clostridiales bacterium]
MADYSISLTIILVLMAISGLIAWKIHFSIAPILIIVGMVSSFFTPQLHLQPALPIINFLGQMGVLFLLFYMGLEFSINRLIKAGKNIFQSGIIYFLINIPLALAVTYLAGFSGKEILIAIGIITISSSSIVAKVLVELHRTANRETEQILGLMIFQDLFVAIYLAILSSIVLSSQPQWSIVLIDTSLAMLFFFGVIIVGRKFSSYLDKFLNIPSDEVFLLTIVAFITLMALASEEMNIAEAIGAMLLGLILAETSHRPRIEHLAAPFRDFFGAAFFFSFGMSIDILSLNKAIIPALAAVFLTIAGNLLAGILISKKGGHSLRMGFNIGLTITSRGEFSIIMADTAKAAGLLFPLQPFAALYVLILSVLGPVLTRYSKQIYALYRRIRGHKSSQDHLPKKKGLPQEYR